jgi:hypothetical protein
MNAVARPWIGLVFKCLSILAAIFAFIFFMRMNEDQSKVDNYRNSGTVSRGVVTEMKLDQMVYEGSGGRRGTSSRTQDIQVLSVRFDSKSTVKYADFPSKVSEADLPAPPAVTGDSAIDGPNMANMWVSRDLYDKTKVGDVLTVVDAPFSGFDPELVADIRDFDPSAAYPNIAIALVLAVLLWLIGWRISKASALRGIAEVAKMPGTLP